MRFTCHQHDSRKHSIGDVGYFLPLVALVPVLNFLPLSFAFSSLSSPLSFPLSLAPGNYISRLVAAVDKRYSHCLKLVIWGRFSKGWKETSSGARWAWVDVVLGRVGAGVWIAEVRGRNEA